MKTKIALVVALGALFVAVPSATSKGKSPAGVNVTVACIENADGTDTCTITATGLSKGTYWVDATDSCGGSLASSASANFDFTFQATDCASAITVQLFSVGRGGALTP